LFNANTYNMPQNEVERHPYLNYFIDMYEGEENVPWNKFTKMIIGSFPVFELTDTVIPISQVRSSNPANWLNFFYGNENNQFWDRLCATFGYDSLSNLSQEDRLAAATSILDKEGIILTDVIRQTNRYTGKKKATPFSPDDHALFNMGGDSDIQQHFALNTSLIDWILKSQNLSAIFFTAEKSNWGKNPLVWFHQILESQGIEIHVRAESSNHLAYTIYDVEQTYKREIDLFFLPPPASYKWIPIIGMQHHMFIKYLFAVDRPFAQSVVPNFFTNGKAEMKMLEAHREDFINHWWRAFLVDKNDKFNGSVDRKKKRKLKEKV
jgi:G:T/U-mismatch repair DNA glycosylase